eukprot:SAG22_NODE_477_length_9978_cov_2.807268_3_plen_110_part_00
MWAISSGVPPPAVVEAVRMVGQDVERACMHVVQDANREPSERGCIPEGSSERPRFESWTTLRTGLEAGKQRAELFFVGVPVPRVVWAREQRPGDKCSAAVSKQQRSQWQ